MTDEEKVARRYRELGAEEPPRALDAAILAAARREVGASPAALPARGGRQRWYAPLATAAVLVLAVAVTLNMQRERPGVESPVAQVQATRPGADPAAAKISSANAEEELKLRPAEELNRKPTADRKPAVKATAPAAAAPPLPAREPQPFAATQAPSSVPALSRSDDARGASSGVTGELARRMEERTARDADAAAQAPRLGAFQVQKEADAQARELDRIAQLRAEGRHDEADRALAEFRKRYPGYRIPDAVRERVERR